MFLCLVDEVIIPQTNLDVHCLFQVDEEKPDFSGFSF